ncbi:MAG TPA: phospho-N-acetylmuramoyl-pentapeptide-transferase [Phycisphaerae bacterium]|nr:phospho-N-acetylmuramoyl-pentapeptide-transferase [Phycisphaerae bacterium]
MIYHLLQYWLGSQGHYGYENPLFRGTVAILVSFLIVWLSGPRVIRFLIAKRLGDIPDFDHQMLNEMTQHKANIPTMGGLLILAAVASSVVLLANLTVYYVYLALACMLWLAALGGIDDWIKLTSKGREGTRDGLKFYQKLLFQIALGVMLAYCVYRRGEETFAGFEHQHYRILTLPFFKGEQSHGLLLSLSLFYVITVLVVTGTSNAVNLTDGMDGLASGCVAICAFVFMLLSYAVGDARVADYLLFPHIPQAGELSVLCGAMMGACMGFLWYNCHPAQVFMGDTGSLPLGGLIGFVAIVIRQEVMLFIVGGVFVMEALSVMLQVACFKTTGKRIFRMSPIHHHFHLKGWHETQVVTRFWLLAVLFAALALATTKLR